MWRLNFLFVYFISFCSFGQQHEIQAWQKAHPDVTFINQDDLDQFSEKDLNRIGKYIIYTDEIQLQDIEYYEAQKTNEVNDSQFIFDARDSEAAYIKTWISEHLDIKILKASYFSQLDSESQERYINSSAMILNGELVTVKDIYNYESNH